MSFREFLRAILSIPIPKPKKPRISWLRRPVNNGLSVKPDEFLIENNKPFRFSRDGASRPIERRQR